MNCEFHYITKNLTLFYGVRFCSFIRFFAQDHLLTIYELILFLVSLITNLFHSFGCSKLTIWAAFFIFINYLCGAFKLSNQFCVACTGQIISSSPEIKRTGTVSSVMREILSFFLISIFKVLDDFNINFITFLCVNQHHMIFKSMSIWPY